MARNCPNKRPLHGNEVSLQSLDGSTREVLKSGPTESENQESHTQHTALVWDVLSLLLV